MRYVSQTPERVRALLFGPRRPDMLPHLDHPAQEPAHVVQAPEVWGALLVLARLRRSGRTPVPLDVHHDQDETGTLVRAYVLPTCERQQALFAGRFTEVSR